MNTGTGFVARTRIRIENGGQRQIGFMATIREEEHVMTCDPYGQFAMRNAVQPLTTGDADTLVNVSVGADLVICTPDVMFMLADRSYKAAGDLAVGDVLKVWPPAFVTLTQAPAPVSLPDAVPVYDMSVPSPSNFALACGPIVQALGTTWAPFRGTTA